MKVLILAHSPAEVRSDRSFRLQQTHQAFIVRCCHHGLSLFRHTGKPPIAGLRNLRRSRPEPVVPHAPRCAASLRRLLSKTICRPRLTRTSSGCSDNPSWPRTELERPFRGSRCFSGPHPRSHPPRQPRFLRWLCTASIHRASTPTQLRSSRLLKTRIGQTIAQSAMKLLDHAALARCYEVREVADVLILRHPVAACHG